MNALIHTNLMFGRILNLGHRVMLMRKHIACHNNEVQWQTKTEEGASARTVYGPLAHHRTPLYVALKNY